MKKLIFSLTLTIIISITIVVPTFAEEVNEDDFDKAKQVTEENLVDIKDVYEKIKDNRHIPAEYLLHANDSIGVLSLPGYIVYETIGRGETNISISLLNRTFKSEGTSWSTSTLATNTVQTSVIYDGRMLDNSSVGWSLGKFKTSREASTQIRSEGLYEGFSVHTVAQGSMYSEAYTGRPYYHLEGIIQ